MKRSMSDDLSSEPKRVRDEWSIRNRHDAFTSATVSTSTKRQLSPSEYTVAWICALPVEFSAARAMLDEEHLPVVTSVGDNNVYLLGMIHGHNVAITSLPAGIYGTTSAALVARDMCSTFQSLTMPLLVGIGGGVPQPGFDIRLGDIVVSTPSSEHVAVI